MELKFRAWDKRHKEMEKCRDLYWFEENGVRDSSGEGYNSSYVIMPWIGKHDKNVVEEMSAIVETKKAEKYPVLLKPTYYPEIDALEISDSEKLRLDRSARWNIRNYISKNNMDRLTYPLSIEDLELLRSVGVAERKYNFRCEECGCSCDVISEEKLEKYKRVWELEKLRNELTDEQDEELEKLYEDGFFNIFLACMDCDEFEKEICNEEELKEYESHIEVLYKIVKQPNLEYEKL